jgi:hypothetical protein
VMTSTSPQIRNTKYEKMAKKCGLQVYGIAVKMGENTERVGYILAVEWVLTKPSIDIIRNDCLLKHTLLAEPNL